MVSAHPDGTRLSVWVVPGANRSEVVGMHGDAVKVRVSAPAEGGRANRAMLSVLSEHLGQECRLESGETSRRKTVVVVGRGPEAVAAALGIGWETTESPR